MCVVFIVIIAPKTLRRKILPVFKSYYLISKGVIHIMDKHPYISLCLFHIHLTNQHKGKYKPTFVSALHLVANCNHRLAMDTKIQHNSPNHPM